MVTYADKNWDAVLEKWCATEEQALFVYPPGHEILDALQDIMLNIGDALAYSEAMSKYLRLIYARTGEQGRTDNEQRRIAGA